MPSLRKFTADRPLLFVIALAVLDAAIGLPLVVIFKLTGLDILPLRLVIPAVQSIFILWLIWYLGWTKKSGLTGTVQNVHLLWLPTLVAFAQVLFYGTVTISWGWIAFYAAALLFTGISEEGFARGIAIPALMRYGKWGALFVAAAIFSAGHLTNAAFESFTLLEWVDKFGNTFGFGVLYGALFLRTGSLLPLIFLHTLLDYVYVTSGTAGPFVAEPLDIRIHLGIAALNTVVGLYLMKGVTEKDMPRIESAKLVQA